jgi:3-oxoacyl-[acyl-carrier protein] reductase
MAQEGAKVVVNDIIAESAEKVMNEIVTSGRQAISFVGDTSDFKTAEKLVHAAVDAFGTVDILHNNAGTTAHNPIWEFTEKDWDLVLGVNLKGPFNCIRHAAPFMIKQKWGRIINASSIARRGTVKNAAYSASKAGILGLTGTAARDLQPYGITCNAYLPTAATQMTASEETRARITKGYQDGHYTKEQYEQLMNPPPAEKIPPLLIYLCTEEAASINGQVFDIAGDYVSLYCEPYKKTTIFKKEGWWTAEELKKAVPSGLLG